MKKTTWVIIGLSICVVVLAAALGLVLLQNKTEKTIVKESDLNSSSNFPVLALYCILTILTHKTLS